MNSIITKKKINPPFQWLLLLYYSRPARFFRAGLFFYLLLSAASINNPTAIGIIYVRVDFTCTSGRLLLFVS